MSALVGMARVRRSPGTGAIASATASPGGPIPAIEPLATQPLTAHAFNADGLEQSVVGRSVTWATSNAAVATVAVTGHGTALVTAVAEGTCNITPTVDGVTGTAVAFAVEEGAGAPPVGAPLLDADWSTATGTTDNALMDGGEFNGTANTPATELEVIAATGLGFPVGMTNVLRVTHHVSPASGWVESDEQWAARGDDESLFYRFYLRNGVPDSEGAVSSSSHHPFETAGGGVGTQGWSFNFGWADDGTFPFKLILVGVSGGAQRWRVRSGGAYVNLSKDTTYRFEFQFTRTAANTYTIHARIYNAADELLYSDSDWATEDVPFTPMTTAGVDIAIPDSDAGLRRWRIGINGGPAVSEDRYHYVGGVMVRADDWAGAY